MYAGVPMTAPVCVSACARLPRSHRCRCAPARSPRRAPAPPVDQHVVRLEVAVHQARRVHGRQPRADLLEHRDHVAPRARRPQPPRQRLAVDVLHRDEQPARVVADLVDAHHVRVLEARHRLRLAQQPRAIALAVDLLAHDLDRDRSAELGVLAGVHDAHPALAEPRPDREVADHRLHARRHAREQVPAAARRARDRDTRADRARQGRARSGDRLGRRGRRNRGLVSDRRFRRHRGVAADVALRCRPGCHRPHRRRRARISVAPPLVVHRSADPSRPALPCRHAPRRPPARPAPLARDHPALPEARRRLRARSSSATPGCCARPASRTACRRSSPARARAG